MYIYTIVIHTPNHDYREETDVVFHNPVHIGESIQHPQPGLERKVFDVIHDVNGTTLHVKE